jgi:hypothetical protein
MALLSPLLLALLVMLPGQAQLAGSQQPQCKELLRDVLEGCNLTEAARPWLDAWRGCANDDGPVSVPSPWH